MPARKSLANSFLSLEPRKSCSQIRITRHPSFLKWLLARRSRARFLEILVSQKSRLVVGSVKWREHPCQKHPSMKTATRYFGKTMSGLPGNVLLRLQPVMPDFFIKRINRSSVEQFPLDRTRDIISDRFDGAKMSAMATANSKKN